MWIRPNKIDPTTGKLAFLAMPADSVRGSIGYSPPCGMATTYFARAGSSGIMAGTYQRRRIGTSRRTRDYRPHGEVPYIAVRRIKPHNPQTETQQANRNKFAAAWTAWNGLTDDQKQEYIEAARRLGLRPHVYFTKVYMRTH